MGAGGRGGAGRGNNTPPQTNKQTNKQQQQQNPRTLERKIKQKENKTSYFSDTRAKHGNQIILLREKWIHFIFLLRKMIRSTCWDFKAARLSVRMSPAVETNHLLEGNMNFIFIFFRHCTLVPSYVKLLWTTHSRRLWKFEDPLLWIFQSFHWYRMLCLNLVSFFLSASPRVICFFVFRCSVRSLRLVRGSTSESVEALRSAPALSMGAGPGGLRTDVTFALPNGLFKSREWWRRTCADMFEVPPPSFTDALHSVQ